MPIRIEEAGRSTLDRDSFALWDLGFRPFYLAAAAFGALSIVLWALQAGGLFPAAYLQGPQWHAHEMLFGFALPVIVGFLFTAGRNWSNLPTPTGRPLMALVALWLAGRVLVLTPWTVPAAIVNVAFPFAAAIAIALPFARARVARNYFFVWLLTLLGFASGSIHLSRAGVVLLPGWAGLQLALDIVLFILCVMAGRVIPMFTNNGVPGAGASRRHGLEWAALASIVALGAAGFFPGLPAGLVATIAVFACAAHAARLWLWHPWKTLRTPMLWVLHLAYLWIPVHLALRAMAALGLASHSLAAHALTTGAMSGLIIGMMTRTARGHTARPLKADSRDIACYLLVAVAAVVRVAGPVAAPEAIRWVWLLSAALWSGGFGLYAAAYWSVLSRARLDGKPG